MFMVVSFAFILFSFIKSSNGDEPAYGAYKVSPYFLLIKKGSDEEQSVILIFWNKMQ